MRTYVVGPVTVELGETIVRESDLPGQQGRTVLAMLAVEHRRPLGRHELADELWPERLPRSWETALRAIVSKLRASLAHGGLEHDLIGNAFGCYQLRLPHDSWLDLDAASRSLHEAEIALARGDPGAAVADALVTCRIASRPFLAGTYGPWVLEQREGISGLHVRARECLADAFAAAGEYERSAGSAEVALKIDPYRERLYQRLIRSRALAGDRTGAARVFARYSDLLARELGIEPTPETVSVFRDSVALRDGRP